MIHAARLFNMRAIKIASIIFVFLLCGILLSVPSITRRSNDAFAKPKIQELVDRVNLYKPKLIEALKVVEAQPPFPTWTRDMNAESYLASYISWEGKDLVQLQSPSHDSASSAASSHCTMAPTRLLTRYARPRTK